MNKIYDFELYEPPALSEATLQAELEARKARRQAALAAVASVILQAALVVLGYSALDWYPWVAALCFASVAVGASGGVVLAALATRKGGLAS